MYMPSGISRDPEQSQIASLAAASAAAFKDYKQVLQKAVEGVPSYKVQVMRMHRLPAYRTRFQQIISQAVSMSNCKVCQRRPPHPLFPLSLPFQGMIFP